MSGSREQSKPARSLAIILGAFTLCWPAFYNRYPLLFPDSISYIGDGSRIARAVFLHQLSADYGMRSLVYSLTLQPFHWNLSVWPIVFLNALITAWILWLVVRCILPRRTAEYYLGIVALLSAFTSASWYVSLIMPDILGPALYLAIYLLVFARDTLSKPERIALALIACWATASHATHLMLAAILCAGLILLLALRPMRRYIRGIAEVAALLTIAALAQISLNAYLYGQPTLDARRPPYLMARILGDGPGRDYLQQHCPHANWLLCDHLANLPATDDEFLWAEGSIWSTATEEQQQELRREELPFVLATLHAYPRQQLAHSLDNAWQQLINFDIHDFDSNTWMDAALPTVLHGAAAPYSRSRQAHTALPEDLFSTIHFWAVILSLPIILLALILRRPPRLIALTLIILPVVAANAALTGILSDLDGRYQARVVWLIPLLAALTLISALNPRPTTL
jgi:hypothetical protein